MENWLRSIRSHEQNDPVPVKFTHIFKTIRRYDGELYFVWRYSCMFFLSGSVWSKRLPRSGQSTDLYE